MSSTLNPYLNFRGQAREAMDFYASVFGGEVTRSTFAEFQVSQEPSEAEWIMHSQITTTAGFTLMAADVPSHMDLKPGSTISISLSGDDEAELTGYYDKLVDGGTVLEPLSKAPWGDSFGMAIDKFGTQWLVNIAGAAPAQS
ncbi:MULTISPECIES: VOC family protein [Leifsonia]|uniref:Glyoxalase family protein n=3 Tax=Leifsonia TaxID=110932 RepID=U2RT31_LEIAQ|nr:MULTISPECIES: VOC family protein [Leifsonia]ERK71714.1 glyoxalase family protein [Leifsonia aquatica ATCC 14665]MBB2966442.1 PhnB protein [Leifsonia aquatica]NYK11791.1 PhnB protein [Leifsonia naganoensis]